MNNLLRQTHAVNSRSKHLPTHPKISLGTPALTEFNHFATQRVGVGVCACVYESTPVCSDMCEQVGVCDRRL